MRSPFLLPWVAVFAAAAVGGCGSSDGLPREPISGTVTLDGQPLDGGMITFTPTQAAEPVVTALIKDGAYSLPRSEGPVPGPHRVQVWAKKPTGKKIPDPDNREEIIDEMRSIVPPRYNLNSELSAEVKAGDSNSFEFTMSSARVAARPASKR